MGIGHTVTALYELIPPGSPDLPSVTQLKSAVTVPTAQNSNDLFTVSLRYKEPQGSVSKLVSKTLIDSTRTFTSNSDDFRFATAVAKFGIHLQKSDFSHAHNYSKLIDIGRNSRGIDNDGLRAEFVKIAETAELLANYDLHL